MKARVLIVPVPPITSTTPDTVPAPGSIAQLGLGLAAGLLASRRARRSA